jgi:hypothetical protein
MCVPQPVRRHFSIDACLLCRTFHHGVDLYLDQQAIDTMTPSGKLMFQITGAFAEFERSMIRTRVNAGLKRAKDQIRQKGHFVTKRGEVRKRLGRPNADPGKLHKAQAELAKGIGSDTRPATNRERLGTPSELFTHSHRSRRADHCAVE